MIEIVMYVTLGFCLAGLLGLIIAPPLWRRAVRLTTQRLHATMPMSLSDIQAERDQLRAQFAIELRRLEISLDKAQRKAAKRLVEQNKAEARSHDLQQTIASLQAEVAERDAELHILRQTIHRRIPDLEREIALSRESSAGLQIEIERQAQTLAERVAALQAAETSATARQQEVEALRRSLEDAKDAVDEATKTKTDHVTALERLAAENKTLAAELAGSREEAQSLKDVAKRETMALKAEMKRLAERIMDEAAKDRGEKDTTSASASEPAKVAPEPSKEPSGKSKKAPKASASKSKEDGEDDIFDGPPRPAEGGADPGSLAFRLQGLLPKEKGE